MHGPLDDISRLVEGGFLKDALRRLRSLAPKVLGNEHAHAQVVLAELLLDTGDAAEARRVASQIARQTDTRPTLRARALSVMAEETFAQGALWDSIRWFQEAVSDAERAGDPAAAARVQIRSVYYFADVVSPHAANKLLSDVKRNALLAANPHIMANVRRCQAEQAAKAGLIDEAREFLDAARRIVSNQPNLLIDGFIALDSCALSFVLGDLEEAVQHATRALELAEQSGHARTKKNALGNLGIIELYRGNLRAACEFLESGLRLPPKDFTDSLIRESYAQLKLRVGALDECAAILNGLKPAFPKQRTFRTSWYDLVFYCTRIRLKLAQKEVAAAYRDSCKALEIAKLRRDDAVAGTLRLLQAEALIMMGRLDEAAGMIADATARAGTLALGTLAESERVRGKLFGRLGQPDAACRHFARALRVLGVTRNACARQDVLDDCRRTLGVDTEALPSPDLELQEATAGPAGASAGRPPATFEIETAGLLLDLGGAPELLGREALAAAARGGWAAAGALAARHAGGATVLATLSWTTTEAARRLEAQDGLVAIALGSHRDRHFALLVEPGPSPYARHAVIGLHKLVDAALALERMRLEEKRSTSLWSFDPLDDSPDGVFLSAGTSELLAIARKIAPTDLPVLLTGETGTGKELLARIIHRSSLQAERPFVPFNCATVPRDLLDSQLFGHRRGAFTGAHERFAGVIGAAAGGTLFLDEIGELGLEAQPKLLRFLETGEIHPLGEPQPSQVRVRVVAATNADIDRLVAAGRFREDLFYRLNVMRLRVPPLRERREEIPPLLQHFIQTQCRELGKAPLRVSDEAMEYLLLYGWPGNVRQLANEVRRIAALAEPGATIEPVQLAAEIRAARRTMPAGDPPDSADPGEIRVRIDQPLPAAVEQIERAVLDYALRQTGGGLEATAQALGISRKGLYLKRQRLGLETRTA